MFWNLEMNSDLMGRTHSVESFQWQRNPLSRINGIRPKPQATISGQPMLWHITHIDSAAVETSSSSLCKVTPI
jgi:hypothetical protein